MDQAMGWKRVILLAGMILAVGGRALADCKPGDPTGLFKGTAKSAQAGELQVTLNLRCDGAQYAGLLVTPVGKLPITGGEVSEGRLRLTFDMGGTPAHVNAPASGDQLNGTFQVGDDSGPLALRRVGDASAGDPTQPSFDLTPAQWRQDLAYFAAELARRHGSAFHRISKANFETAVERLSVRLDGLDRDQIYVGFDRLANMIGDGHTFVTVPPDSADMPIALRLFGDDYRVVEVAPGLERALGARLVAIGNVSARRAMDLALTLTPGDETLALRKDRTAGFLTSGLMVHGLGIAPRRDRIRYTFQQDKGAPFAVELAALPPGPEPDWKRPFAKAALFRQHPDQAFWCASLKAQHALYCNFQGYGDLANRSREMSRLMAADRPRKLIIDLRLNGGGDFNKGLRYVIEPIARDPDINRKGRLYVLIGRGTFSAGMSNAAQFRSKTRALLVGEPIGERPNTWQEPRQMLLPNSHLTVRYSTRFYRFVDGGENLVRPDKEIAPTWAQYAAGDDPVLDWVLARPAG